MKVDYNYLDNPYQCKPSYFKQEESTQGRISQQSSFLSSIIPELRQIAAQRKVVPGEDYYGRQPSKRPAKHHKKTLSTEDKLIKLAKKVKKCQYEIMMEKTERRRLERELQKRKEESSRKKDLTKVARAVGKFTNIDSNVELSTMHDSVEKDKGPTREIIRPSNNHLKSASETSRKISFAGENTQKHSILMKSPKRTDPQLKQLLEKFEQAKARLEHAESPEIRRKIRKELITVSEQIQAVTKRKSEAYKGFHER